MSLRDEHALFQRKAERADAKALPQPSVVVLECKHAVGRKSERSHRTTVAQNSDGTNIEIDIA